MIKNIVQKAAEFYRIEVEGSGPFKGVLVHKKSGLSYIFPEEHETPDAAVLIARTRLIAAIKKNVFSLA